MRLLILTMIAAASLSAASLSAANAPQPGTRGPVVQTDAPAPTPTRAPVVLNA